ncbi:unnamed protein product [Schistosoma margrebowiei]|uniref:Uncharacterized protein n=1 Tax=Schistosoma margrebowiei TaxID=48269 RepID=A0A183MJI7_9TREM|nr:unnamed protein product [Schistosoma margrebowiei]
MVAGDQQQVHTPFVPSGYRRTYAPLILNEVFTTPLGLYTFEYIFNTISILKPSSLSSSSSSSSPSSTSSSSSSSLKEYHSRKSTILSYD